MIFSIPEVKFDNVVAQIYTRKKWLLFNSPITCTNCGSRRLKMVTAGSMYKVYQNYMCPVCQHTFKECVAEY